MMQRSVLLLAFVALLSVAAYAFEQPRPLAPFDGPLTGREMLLQLGDLSGKLPAGIYALDPFAEKPEPRLLVPNGERPTWSRTRKYFAYLRGGALCLANCAGKNWQLAWPGFYNTHLLRANDPPLLWLPEDACLRPQWSEPFGTRLALALGPDRRREPPGNWLLFPDLPLYGFWRHNQGGEAHKPGWDDMAVIRSLDLAPDWTRMVAELSPPGFYDLPRAQSKLYVYPTSPNTADWRPGWLYSLSLTTGGPKRLTKLGDGLPELAPMVSPDGEWVAFTLVHPQEHYTSAAVCRLDGSDYSELIPPTVAYIGGPWQSPGELTDYDSDSPNYGGPGRPRAYPIRWSPSGRYLLMGEGERFSQLFAAKHTDTGWQFRDTEPLVVTPQSLLGGVIYYAAMGTGPEGEEWVAAASGAPSVGLLPVEGQGESTFIPLADSVRILWLDW